MRGSSVIGSILIVVGLYSVLWGKYKEYQEKQAQAIGEAVKGGGENGRTAMIKDDIEANNIEVQKSEAQKPSLPVTVISGPIPQPPMLDVEEPKP